METKNNEKFLALLEALLFIYGEPLAIKKIATILATDEPLVAQLATTLNAQYSATTRGISVLRNDDKLQLVTTPDATDAIQTLMQYEHEEALTTAALETLAIIAYRGPLERAAIEEMRGVNSTVTLRNLSLRGLIEKQISENKKEMYAITGDCLKQLGIGAQEELPEYATHHEPTLEK